MDNNTKIVPFMLDDGRKAERHFFIDEDGQEVEEVFAEEKRPLKLESRKIRESKTIVAKETVEKIRDGEIVSQEVYSLDAEVPMQLRERVGVTDHHKIVDGEYVSKTELQDAIVSGVVAGVSAIFENMEPIKTQSVSPVMRVQSLVEQQVLAKSDNTAMTWWIIGGAALFAEAAFGLWWVFLR